MNSDYQKLRELYSKSNKKHQRTRSVVLEDPIIACARRYLETPFNSPHLSRKIRTETRHQHSERIRNTAKQAGTAFVYNENTDPGITSAAVYQDPTIHSEHAKIFKAQNCLEDVLHRKPFITDSNSKQRLAEHISTDGGSNMFLYDGSSKSISDFYPSLGKLYSSSFTSNSYQPRSSNSSQLLHSEDNLTYSVHSSTTSMRDVSHNTLSSMYCKNPENVPNEKEQQFTIMNTVSKRRSTMDFFKNFNSDLTKFRLQKTHCCKSFLDLNNNNKIIVEKYDDDDEDHIEEDTPPPSQQSLLSIPSSIENVSYTPKVCPQYFYDWVDKMPISKKFDCNANVCNFKVNNNVKMNGVKDPRSLRVQNGNSKKMDANPYEKIEKQRAHHEPSKNYTAKKSANKIQDGHATKKQNVVPVPVAEKSIVDQKHAHLYNFPKWEGHKDKTDEAALVQQCDCCKCQKQNLDKVLPHKKNRQHSSLVCNEDHKDPDKNRNPKSYIFRNRSKILRMAPARPDPFFIDDRKGTRHNYIRSGLAPIYILGQEFGKIPEYLEGRRKELGLPPTDLSSYRKRKRCYRCGHDHAVCELKRMEDEKLNEIYKQRHRNRSHMPGMVPVF